MVCHEISKLETWFAFNKLSLDVSKTNYMIFSNFKINHDFQLFIGRNVISRVSETKFLGVIIDDNLNWHSRHINEVCRKLYKGYFIVKRASHVLSKYPPNMLYNSMCLPYISYCCEIWGNTSAYALNTILLLQKKWIRMLHKANYLDHTKPLFMLSKYLPLNELVKYSTLLVMYKSFHNLLQQNVQNIFEITINNRSNRKPDRFSVKYAKKQIKKQISINLVSLWNDLPVKLSMLPTLQQFKKHLSHSLIA